MTEKKFPTLYKKTSTGKIQFWDISCNESRASETGDDEVDVVSTIVTTYGQMGTDSPQTTYDNIKEGKNVGKKNETTAYEQAKAEALSKWQQQKKKGYVESLEAAEANETDDLIEGGIVPMLAHKFVEQAHKIKYPAFVQPKLDGIRCIAIVKDGAATLWSRTRKPITSCPHIIQELEAAFETRDIILDGELYNHEMKNEFEKIVSLVRQEEPGEGYEIVQYHVYDKVDGDIFKDRYSSLRNLFDAFEFYSIQLVETGLTMAEDGVMDFFDQFRAAGYEGAMVRNADSLYVNKRSYDLQKVKEFEDSEFDIIGVEEGRGKLAGHAIFVCKTDSGKEFLAKMKGDTAKLKEYFDNHDLWKNRQLVIQYQGLTTYGIPRFPVGLRIKEII